MVKPISIIYTAQDDKAAKATFTINIPSTHTLPGAIEFAVDAAGLANAMMTGKLVGCNIVVPVDVSGVGPASPGATSDVEEKAQFQFDTDGGYKTMVTIPTLSDLLVVGGSDVLDFSETDISDFSDMMVDGITPTTYATLVEPCDSRSDDIGGLDFGRERFRASGKR